MAKYVIVYPTGGIDLYLTTRETFADAFAPIGLAYFRSRAEAEEQIKKLPPQTQALVHVVPMVKPT